jgi:plasmid stability protein
MTVIEIPDDQAAALKARAAAHGLTLSFGAPS